jgi:Holliday junction DNA helicase RuvA
MTLFGFLDARERDIYEQLQSVTGVGPKVALAITGVLSPEDLASAIALEDVAAIEKVPGIGKKGAQRLILELKGKLVSELAAEPRSGAVSSIREQLLSALTGLGFTAKEADKAINSTFAHLSEISENPDKYELSELLRLTLQSGKR